MCNNVSSAGILPQSVPSASHHNSPRWCRMPSLTKYQAFLNPSHFCSFFCCRYCKWSNPLFFWDIYLSFRHESVSKQLQHLYHWIAACFSKWKPYNVIQCPIIIVSLSIIITDCWLSSWQKKSIFASRSDSKYWLKSIQLWAYLFPFIAIMMVWLFGIEGNCKNIIKIKN